MSKNTFSASFIAILSKVILGVLALFAILILAFPIGFYGMVMYLEPTLPDVKNLDNSRFEMPLQIYTADNKLIGQYGNRYSLPVTFDEIPERMIQAFLAAEDDTFFEHSGISVKGMGRALTEVISDKIGRAHV